MMKLYAALRDLPEVSHRGLTNLAPSPPLLPWLVATTSCCTIPSPLVPGPVTAGCPPLCCGWCYRGPQLLDGLEAAVQSRWGQLREPRHPR